MTPLPFCDSDLPSDASAADLLALAGSYHTAAETLFAGPGGAAASAPGRFCALHAIELYLDAFLRALGEPPGRLRAQGHDLRLRAALAIELGLGLRRKTVAHLARLTLDRENLALRYGPLRPHGTCDANRLRGSLAEIARKVCDAAAARRAAA